MKNGTRLLLMGGLGEAMCKRVEIRPLFFLHAHPLTHTILRRGLLEAIWEGGPVKRLTGYRGASNVVRRAGRVGQRA